ncbi:MAG: dihydrofolate reductase family protein [Pseudonocardiales bacterium]|nr:dihydrofolate reductase family protein [Pseudonocardiales bacterium]
MGSVIAQITMSLDGYVTGPADGPGCGLGVGGERLHYWVFGGPWSYDAEPTGGATGVDKEYLDASIARLGAVIGGRATFEAAEGWGGSNPWDVPFFVLTHRTDDAPPGFTFVDGFATALVHAREAAGERDVIVMGGADVIRQALAAREVDELGVSVAPVILGGGKRLFDDFVHVVQLEQIDALRSPWATHLRYRVI